MKLLSLKKVHDGRYLKNYELTYENKAGRNKVYEIVSRKELHDVADLGRSTSGVSIIAFQGDKMLLLKEFRMGKQKVARDFQIELLHAIDIGHVLVDDFGD